MKNNFDLSKVYALLEPGPVVLVSSRNNGRNNIMAMSWHMMIDFNPPLVGCVISEQNHSFKMIKSSGECVINIPTHELAEKVVACGNISGKDTDKFSRFSLTPAKASKVKAPLIKECYASLECRLVDGRMTGKYNLFVFKVVKAWVDRARKNPKTIHHRGGESFMVAGKAIKIKSGMA